MDVVELEMSQGMLEPKYDPTSIEPEMYRLWEESGAFRAVPDGRSHKNTFTIVIPPPNVTGALHLGHALNNTLQDILIRYHRMRGFNTLWQPGTDHAGIATQAVVERRIRESEGKTRHELGATEVEAREELVRRIWQWKHEYEKRILNQLKLMGCSCDWGFKEVGGGAFECDWSRTRFTLDEGLSTAVRYMFFKLFQDGLIFRGKRLVNWDTQLQTAVSDDEVYHETVKGHFWHFRYPVIEPRQGEPDFVVIATTRPETMLGDTAVAVHPQPAEFFSEHIEMLRDQFANASEKEKAEIEKSLRRIAERQDTHLTQLVKLRDMARDGRQLRLPLVNRRIPLITDEWANPMLGSGCVKITPAHDPNDYEVGLRHNLAMINVLTPDGKIAPIIEPDPAAAKVKPSTSQNVCSEKYAGLTFTGDGRKQVVADLEELELLFEVEDRETEIGHSDRSKLPIEPYLSDQWFVRTGEEKGTEGLRDEGAKGITLGDGRHAPGLAQAAMDVVNEGRVQVFPPRYAKSYLDWLGEKRDWCISRQLWWGHRISVWRTEFAGALIESSRVDSDNRRVQEALIGRLRKAIESLTEAIESVAPTDFEIRADDIPSWCQICTLTTDADHLMETIAGSISMPFTVQRQIDPAVKCVTQLLAVADREPDVLDTWFSSALWPFSTLGWPEETPHLKQYYPGSVLCTSRDIITNWVARMVMFGLYATGKVPFDHVYIHPKILDGRGETMSKSKGNGVDPVDIIHTNGADALRYTMADMCTETQDIRMPVDYICPHCGKLTEQTLAVKAEEQRRKSRGEKLERRIQPADCHRIVCVHKECDREFATQWADQSLKNELGVARETSEKFEIGRNFCNKLWNAARFAFMNLEGTPCETLDVTVLPPEDRWILARLSQTIRRYHEYIAGYRFSASINELRVFFWESLCDWYIELTKPRLAGEPPTSIVADVDQSRDREGAVSGTGGQATRGTQQGGDDNEPRASASANSESRPQPQLDGGATPQTLSEAHLSTCASAQQVLAFCLDQTLRLMHPTMPFITERLWQQLHSLAPQRGLPGIVELNTDGALVLAEFPPVEGFPPLEDAAVLKTFSVLQDATRGVREVRTRCKVSPKEQLTVTVVLPQADIEAFQANAHILRHMAGIGSLSIVADAPRPKNSGSVTIGGMRIFVHDISDDAADLKQTEKSLLEVEKQIVGKEKKLGNEKFVANAKPEIVEAERERLSELLTKRDALLAHCAELRG